jgi:hypothetical protein
MAESGKPDYFFTPDDIDNSLEIISKEVSVAEGDGQVELDFEEFQARRWPGEPCAW